MRIKGHSAFELPFNSADHRVYLIFTKCIRVCRAENELNNRVDATLFDPSVRKHLCGVLRQKV